MLLTLEIRRDEEAATAARVVCRTSIARSNCYDDAMDAPPADRRQINGKLSCASWVEKNAIRKLRQPSLGATDLCNGLLDRAAIPSRPYRFEVGATWPFDGLVAEDDDVIAAYDKEIAKFLAVAFAPCLRSIKRFGYDHRFKKVRSANAAKYRSEGVVPVPRLISSIG